MIDCQVNSYIFVYFYKQQNVSLNNWNKTTQQWLPLESKLFTFYHNILLDVSSIKLQSTNPISPLRPSDWPVALRGDQIYSPSGNPYPEILPQVQRSSSCQTGSVCFPDCPLMETRRDNIYPSRWSRLCFKGGQQVDWSNSLGTYVIFLLYRTLLQ